MAGGKPEKVSHEGVITALDEKFITVEILSKSACAECHAKGMCAASDQQTKVIEIPHNITSLSGGFEVGEKVNVLLEPSMAVEAVLISYGVPLFVLMVLLLILLSVGISELLSGLISMGAVALYYVILSFFSGRLKRVFTFSVEKLDLE